MPLGDVKEFIEQNDHLPAVPSAELMVEKGLDVLESDAMLLRKIEEAYLYILQQNDKMNDMERNMKKMKEEIEELKRK